MRSTKPPHILRNGKKHPKRENDSLITKFEDFFSLEHKIFFNHSLNITEIQFSHLEYYYNTYSKFPWVVPATIVGIQINSISPPFLDPW